MSTTTTTALTPEEELELKKQKYKNLFDTKDPNGTAEITKPEFEELIKKDLNMNVDLNDKFNDILKSSGPNVDFQTFIDFLMPPASGSSSSAAVASTVSTNPSAIPSPPLASAAVASTVSTNPSAIPSPPLASAVSTPPSPDAVYLIVQKTGDEIKEKTDPITVTGFTDDIFAIRITPGTCPTSLGDKQVCFEYDGKNYIVEWGLTDPIADVQKKPLTPVFLETSAAASSGNNSSSVATSATPLATTSGGPPLANPLVATTSANTSTNTSANPLATTLYDMGVLMNYINLEQDNGRQTQDIIDEVNKQRNDADLQTFITKVLDTLFLNTPSSSSITHKHALINGVSCDMSRIHLFKDVPLKTPNDVLEPVLEYIDSGIPNDRPKYFEQSKELCSNIKTFPDFIFDSVDSKRVSVVEMKETENINDKLQTIIEDFVVFIINRVPDIFDRSAIIFLEKIGNYTLVSTILDTVDGNNAYVNYESSPPLHFANGLIKEFKQTGTGNEINEDQYNEYKALVEKWITTRDMNDIDKVIKFHKDKNLLEGVDENFALKDKLVSVVLYRKNGVIKGGSRKKRGRKTGTRRKYYVYNK